MCDGDGGDFGGDSGDFGGDSGDFGGDSVDTGDSGDLGGDSGGLEGDSSDYEGDEGDIINLSDLEESPEAIPEFEPSDDVKPYDASQDDLEEYNMESHIGELSETDYNEEDNVDTDDFILNLSDIEETPEALPEFIAEGDPKTYDAEHDNLEEYNMESHVGELTDSMDDNEGEEIPETEENDEENEEPETEQESPYSYHFSGYEEHEFAQTGDPKTLELDHGDPPSDESEEIEDTEGAGDTENLDDTENSNGVGDIENIGDSFNIGDLEGTEDSEYSSDMESGENSDNTQDIQNTEYDLSALEESGEYPAENGIDGIETTDEENDADSNEIDLSQLESDYASDEDRMSDEDITSDGENAEVIDLSELMEDAPGAGTEFTDIPDEESEEPEKEQEYPYIYDFSGYEEHEFAQAGEPKSLKLDHGNPPESDTEEMKEESTEKEDEIQETEPENSEQTEAQKEALKAYLLGDAAENNLESPALSEEDLEVLTEHYREIGLDEKQIEQVLKDPDQRTWRGAENVDALQHPGFDTQKSFVKEDDGYSEAVYGEKGSQRPDEIRFTEDGVEIREVKNYSNADSLARNIKDQSADRYEMFGDDLKDLTYVVSPKFTLEEADKLQKAADESGADIEFKYH